MYRKFAFAVVFVLTALFVGTFATNKTQPALAQTPKPAPKEESKFQIAQRSLTTAIANLEAYLRENPNGKDAPVARIQLKGLNNLMPSAMTVLPAEFKQPYHQFTAYNHDSLEWYVEAVDRQADKTRITLVIHNTLEATERSFYGFNESPLILVDNKGEFYAMQDVPDVPDTIKKLRFNNDKQYKLEWVLQGGRTLHLTVDFAPLAPDATSGKVQFKDDNPNTFAAFSLLNKKQKPKE